MTFEEWKNEHLCDDDVQLIDLCEDAYQAGERAGMCIRHEEYFSQEVNHHAKCPWCALEQAEEMVAAMQAVLDAAKVIAKWMEFWLHEDLCECEDTHSCGKLERRAELLSYHDAVDAMEIK